MNRKELLKKVKGLEPFRKNAILVSETQEEKNPLCACLGCGKVIKNEDGAFECEKCEKERKND